MASNNAYLRNLDKNVKGVAFASGASAVFGGITAVNTGRQARTQQDQLALQHEEHALQRAITEQTARHEFSMWRQTLEGAAFVDWQKRAAVLIPLLRSRDRTWHAAWAQAIARANAETPEAEKQRWAKHPARLIQNGLKAGFIVCLIATILFGVIFLLQMLTVLTRGDAGIIFVNLIVYGFPAVLFLGLTIMFARLRASRIRAAQTDPLLRDEADARTAKWGFDPLAIQGAWFAWHESDGFVGYADHIEHMVRTGASHRPEPSELVTLIVPEPRGSMHPLPAEINDVLEGFRQENASFGS